MVSKHSLKPNIIKLLVNSAVRSSVAYLPQDLYIFCLTTK
jgi:hypothetical protein